MITIINVRTHFFPEGAVYVGRRTRSFSGSPLGNPYVLRNEAERAEVYADYDQWLQAQLVNPTSPQSKEIARLVEIARAGDLTLACWCAPKLCHADVIKQVIEKRLIPEAQARYGGVGSPVSGARRIIVDRCPYCGSSHYHLEVIDGEDGRQRRADCQQGEYRLVFTEQD